MKIFRRMFFTFSRNIFISLLVVDIFYCICDKFSIVFNTCRWEVCPNSSYYFITNNINLNGIHIPNNRLLMIGQQKRVIYDQISCSTCENTKLTRGNKRLKTEKKNSYWFHHIGSWYLDLNFCLAMSNSKFIISTVSNLNRLNRCSRDEKF